MKAQKPRKADSLKTEASRYLGELIRFYFDG